MINAPKGAINQCLQMEWLSPGLKLSDELKRVHPEGGG